MGEIERSSKGVGPLKTENSYRTITIDSTPLDHLMEYKKWQEHNQLNNKYYIKSDFLMIDDSEELFSIQNRRIK